MIPFIKQRVLKESIQNQHAHILNSSSYVDTCILKNRSERSTLSKIRLSAHCLEIEKGRQNSIHLNDRLCKMCNKGVIEDEVHFLLNCEKYTKLRQSFQYDTKNYLNLSNNINNRKLLSCLDCSPLKVLKITSLFINKCFF